MCGERGKGGIYGPAQIIIKTPFVWRSQSETDYNKLSHNTSSLTATMFEKNEMLKKICDQEALIVGMKNRLSKLQHKKDTLEACLWQRWKRAAKKATDDFNK